MLLKCSNIDDLLFISNPCFEPVVSSQIYSAETSVQLSKYFDSETAFYSDLSIINGPRHDKTFLRGFLQSETQTSLLSYRD